MAAMCRGERLVFTKRLALPVHHRLADNRIAAHLHLAEGYVSKAYCIKPGDFYIVTRGERNVAEARQLMMYLAHVEFGLTLKDAGKRYHRDRSTASYACRTIEDRRDDPLFDAMVCQIEDLVSLREDPLFTRELARLA